MKTWLDWSAYKDAGMGDAYADIPKHGGDYAKAIAACINSRQCETMNKSVMCPSYKVSSNPNFSTGGRVRALKAVLNEDPNALFDADLEQAMKLCVSCKGCKRECESNVDMALIKAEYLAQRNAKLGLSKRARLFAHTPRWLAKAPWLRLAIGWRNRWPWLATQLEKHLAISAQVPLPVPAASPYQEEQATAESKPSGDSQTKEVVLFVDTFNRYFEPDIARAAHQVLSGQGYRVIPLFPQASEQESRSLCCGRTFLAQGMIEQARAEAQRLMDALLPHTEQGRTVVGLEASCVLGLRDDNLALGLGEDAKLLGKNVLLLEEFLAREIKANRLTFNAPATMASTLIHGHCHQKAMGAMKSMRRVLKQLPGLDFSMIESSCCGMAGTFGLEAEQAEVSRQMAELELVPSLQQAPQAQVVANGFSCRHQIRARGEREPIHLAQLLARYNPTSDEVAS